jgi:hypothetical protein
MQANDSLYAYRRLRMAAPSRWQRQRGGDRRGAGERKSRGLGFRFGAGAGVNLNMEEHSAVRGIKTVIG